METTTIIEELKKEIDTIKKSLEKRDIKHEKLLKDLKDERDVEYQLSIMMIRTRINNLKIILGELDASISMNSELVKYLSKKEQKDEQEKIDRYREEVFKLRYEDQDDLKNCEEKIAALEARIKITLSARSNVFNDSVYLFLHKARKEKYINIVNNTACTVTWIHILIANLTILFQMGVYYFIIQALFHEQKHYDSLEKDDSDEYFPTPDWLYYCTMFGAFGVLLGNLLPDIIGVFVLRIRWKLWAQFLILLEAWIALATAFVLLGVRGTTDPTEPFLELFLGMVGIIFIHTLDESIRLAMDTYGLLQQRGKVGVWIVLVYVVITIPLYNGLGKLKEWTMN